MAKYKQQKLLSYILVPQLNDSVVSQRERMSKTAGQRRACKQRYEPRGNLCYVERDGPNLSKVL